MSITRGNNFFTVSLTKHRRVSPNTQDVSSVVRTKQNSKVHRGANKIPTHNTFAGLSITDD